MIGIIAAMPLEAERLIAKLDSPEERVVSGVTFTRGKLSGKDVVIAVCGIGKVFAAICAEAMILEYSPELIINTGVGGAVADCLKIFDVVVSADLVQHDMDTTALGDPPGLISGINVVRFNADREAGELMKSCLEKAGVRCFFGTVASGDQFISDAGRKDFIKNTFGAWVCEMEGASIAQVCFVNGVRFLAVRAVSDSADGSSGVDYPVFAAEAAKNSAFAVESFVGAL